MTDFTPLLLPDRGERARTLTLVDKGNADEWRKALSAAHRALADAGRFDPAKPGALLLLPTGDAVDAVASVKDRTALSPWCLAAAASVLPEGRYRLAEGEAGLAALGWLLAHHRFDRYKSAPDPLPARRSACPSAQ